MKEIVLSFFKGNGLVIYYAFLLGIMMSWTDFHNFPPMALRLLYMVLVLAPALIDKNGIMPAALTCFWGIAINGYAYSYMPTMTYLYVFTLVIGLLFMKRTDKESISYKGFFLPMILFVLLTTRDLIADLEVQSNSPCFLLLALLPAYVYKWDTKAHIKMEWAFMFLSIVLAYYSFTAQSLFYGDYGTYAGEERSVWADPNYLATTMAIGILIGFQKLVDFKGTDKYTKIVATTCIVLTFPAMLLLASRGGMLCLAAGALIIILFSKTSYIVRIICAVILIGFVTFLYTNSFFDMLEARLDSGDTTGSERTVIWENRLNAFANSENPLYWLFGYAYHGGLHLGWIFEFGSHNDYIAFLSEYGIVGLLLFVCMLISPILNLEWKSKQKVQVFAYTIFISIAVSTIEPFTLGKPIIFLFWFYIILLTQLSKQETVKQKAKVKLLILQRKKKTKQSQLSE